MTTETPNQTEAKGCGGLDVHVDALVMPYCRKEFLTDAPEPSTSSVVSFCGNVQWGRNDKPEPLSFLEISNCHEKARLHRTYEMTAPEWINQVERLRDHINSYLDYLKA